jgi:hypothetical protein
MTITRTGKKANFPLICNTPRDAVFPGRVKIKITISQFTISYQ